MKTCGDCIHSELQPDSTLACEICGEIRGGAAAEECVHCEPFDKPEKETK